MTTHEEAKKTRRLEERGKAIADDKIAAMRSATCAWPGCSKKNFMFCSLQLFKTEGEGDPVPEKGVSVPIPYCDLHFHYAAAGLIQVVKRPDQEGTDNVGVNANYQAIELCEAVFKALTMHEKMKGAHQPEEDAE
jgi:hypothetical protein